LGVRPDSDNQYLGVGSIPGDHPVAVALGGQDALGHADELLAAGVVLAGVLIDQDRPEVLGLEVGVLIGRQQGLGGLALAVGLVAGVVVARVVQERPQLRRCDRWHASSGLVG
jgi:hypothetical protein